MTFYLSRSHALPKGGLQGGGRGYLGLTPYQNKFYFGGKNWPTLELFKLFGPPPITLKPSIDPITQSQFTYEPKANIFFNLKIRQNFKLPIYFCKSTSTRKQDLLMLLSLFLRFLIIPFQKSLSKMEIIFSPQIILLFRRKA